MTRISNWCRQLLRACVASQLQSGPGYKVRRTKDGTFLELDNYNASTVYVKCCLGDGTEAYLPVLVRGKVFTANAGTTTALTVTTGNVPDGNIVLE